MRPAVVSAGLAADPKALSDLRRRAATDEKGTLREVAKQFEAMLLDVVVKSMRATVPGDGPLDSAGSQMFTEMLDQQFVQGVSAQGGLGLADVLVRQLSQLHGHANQASGPAVDTKAGGKS